MTQLSKMSAAELIAWLDSENRAKVDRARKLELDYQYAQQINRTYEEKRRER